MTPAELLELSGTEILRRLFHQENLRRFDSASMRFACRCSRARVGGVIRMIGADEAHAILAEKGAITVTCEFCRETYVFDPRQAEEALRDVAAGTPPPA
jgi:molecular chaperone Hsp33